MNLFSAITLLTITTVTAHARLGETREQAEARYGLPKSEKPLSYVTPLLEGARELEFHHQGFKIRCALLLATDGKEYIVREEYNRLEGNPIIKDFELDAILEGERNGSKWTQKKVGSISTDITKTVQSQFALMLAGKTWIRPDGAVAALGLGGLPIRLELPQAAQHEARLEALKDQHERAAVPKF